MQLTEALTFISLICSVTAVKIKTKKCYISMRQERFLILSFCMMSNYLMYEKCWNTFRFIEVYMHRLHWSCELWFRSWFVNCNNWKNWCGQECCGNTFLGKNVDLVPVHYQWLRYCKNKNKTVTQLTKCGRHQGLWILENQVFDQQINC